MTHEQQRRDAEKVIQGLLERNESDAIIPQHIPVEGAEGLLARLRKRDLQVLATPIVHG
jgi:hypothetical protein